MLPLPSAWAHKTRLSTKTRILKLWDIIVPIIIGTCVDEVCSFLLHGLGEPMSVLGCYTSTYYFTDGPHGQGMGRGRGQDYQAGASGTQGHVYAVVLQTELAYQYDIQGTFRLSHFLIRVLFKFECIVFMFILT